MSIKEFHAGKRINSDLNIFLLIGQSNMAGRGNVEDVPLVKNNNILMFRNDRWILAEEPLHMDSPEAAGIGLGMSFAVELWGKYQDERIGLVPCAVGGTPLSRWMPGADLYKNCVTVIQHALTAGKLKGILWHQGESDSNTIEDASTYAERFYQMTITLRDDLPAQNIPIVAGELGEFLEQFDGCNYFKMVNKALHEVGDRLPLYSVARSTGLLDKGDKIHFNSRSLCEFGKRYADQYLKTSSYSLG